MNDNAIFGWRSEYPSMHKKLDHSFYQNTDVVEVARHLLGKYLVTDFGGQYCSGVITEVEAYRAPNDKACHAYNNRRTKRTEIMFWPGGVAYVYLCYGIHHLFNVITGDVDMAHAVLIRAVEAQEGLDIMEDRRGVSAQKPQLSAGPGVMSKAMGITTAWTGQSLVEADSPIWIEDRGQVVKEESIGESTRIGVDYAEECALWPWRFFLKESKWVSRFKPPKLKPKMH